MITASKRSTKISRPKAKIESAANDLLTEGKKIASSAYKQGRKKINGAEAQLKGYSDDLLKQVQKKPLASLLIASGVGFLLSSILRK